MELAFALFLLFAVFGGGDQPAWDPSMGAQINAPRLSRSVVPATEADFLQLARIIHAEARGEPFEGMVGVGAVIVNRVNRSDFPDTITEVIFAENQFSGVPYMPSRDKVCDKCWDAARAALAGQDPTGEAIFFYNPDTSVALDWWATRPITRKIGNHVFAK